MSKGIKLRQKHSTVAAPQSAVRVTIILTAEMIGMVSAEAEKNRETSGGVLLNPNRSDVLRRIVGLHYRIPAERWETVGPLQTDAKNES